MALTLGLLVVEEKLRRLDPFERIDLEIRVELPRSFDSPPTRRCRRSRILAALDVPYDQAGRGSIVRSLESQRTRAEVEIGPFPECHRHEPKDRSGRLCCSQDVAGHGRLVKILRVPHRNDRQSIRIVGLDRDVASLAKEFCLVRASDRVLWNIDSRRDFLNGSQQRPSCQRPKDEQQEYGTEDPRP